MDPPVSIDKIQIIYYARQCPANFSKWTKVSMQNPSWGRVRKLAERPGRNRDWLCSSKFRGQGNYRYRHSTQTGRLSTTSVG